MDQVTVMAALNFNLMIIYSIQRMVQSEDGLSVTKYILCLYDILLYYPTIVIIIFNLVRI